MEKEVAFQTGLWHHVLRNTGPRRVKGGRRAAMGG